MSWNILGRAAIVVLLTIVWCLNARAEPFVTIGTSPSGLSENVLFNGGLPGTGTSIQGHTNITKAILEVTSSSSLQVTPGIGHSGFGGESSSLFSNVILAPFAGPIPSGFTQLGNFAALVFSLDLETAGQLTITAFDAGSTDTFSQTFNVGTNGRKWFYLIAAEGHTLSKVTIQSQSGAIIESLGHIRVDAAGANQDNEPTIPTLLPPAPTHTPEPASLVLWALCAGIGCGVAKYRSHARRRSCGVAPHE